MSRRAPANENRTVSDFLTVSQIASDLSCDRGMVYHLIQKGDLLGVKPFHDRGVIRVPRANYDAYKARVIGAAEERRPAAPTAAGEPAPRRAKPRVIVDSPEERAAASFFRQRGAFK